MAVRMLVSTKGAAEASGATVRIYEAGEVLNTDEEWAKELAHIFVTAGLAEIHDDNPVEETKVLRASSKPVRARNQDGTLKSDDPSTPDINEAWEGGVAPKKKRSRSTKKK